MRAQRLFTFLAAGLTLAQVPVPTSARAQEYEENAIEVRVWMDRGNEPVLHRGESVRLYYRTSVDAFVAIFHIDTNGTTRLVFPNSPQENHYARGARDYRVLFPGSSYWFVDEEPGMGYFFIVASPEPFSFSELGYSHYGGGWDLSLVGRQVYRDPYLAMDDYVAALVPDWEYVPYGLDFTAYHVEHRYEYPRFMCYDCHGFRPFYAWNPYLYACTSFRVVIYNDPYYYPVTRYRGTRVVYVQPLRGAPHFAFKERAAGEPWTPQVIPRETPPPFQPGVEGTARRRTQDGVADARSGGTADTGSPLDRNDPGSRIPVILGGSARRPSASGGGSSVTPPDRSTYPGRTGISSPTAPGRPIVTPPPPGESRRPVLQPRATGGSTNRQGATSSGTGSGSTRPSARVRGSGTSGATRPPAARSGGSGGTVRPTVRSGGAGATRPPAARSGVSGGTVRPTIRSGGAGATRPPAARSGGSGGTVRPTVRSGGSGATRPPAAKRSGSGGSGRSQPARSARPPVKRSSGGGG